MKYFCLLMCIIGLPSMSEAALIINEVAWMGTEVSANDEWIELYNQGPGSVSVDGWILSDDMNLEIELTGNVADGQYVVLERTDDDSAPGSAFLVYTGSLSNVGTTLVLRDVSGLIQDQVSGGENWVTIGGDNTTKETAQYTTAGWITAEATPGFMNETVNTVVGDELDTDSDEFDADEDTESKVSKTTNTSVQLQLAEKNLSLQLELPNIAYVHQPITFEVEPKGLEKGLLDSLSYRWNYGDLNVDKGASVEHQYLYPGTYAVTLEAEYARHSAGVRHVITVLPVAFSITRNIHGDIQINNDSKYEVDVSGYAVTGKESLVFPPGSILLPNSTITIPVNRLGINSIYALFDQMNAVVASTLPKDKLALPMNSSDLEPVTAATQVQTVTVRQEPKENFQFSSSEKPSNTTTNLGVDTNIQPRNTNSATVNQAAVPLGRGQLPIFGLIALLVIGVLSLYVSRIKNVE